jgi:hypothetical protein
VGSLRQVQKNKDQFFLVGQDFESVDSMFLSQKNGRFENFHFFFTREGLLFKLLQIWEASKY